MNLPRIILLAGSHRVEALVARTDEHRELGLMHRESLAEDEGMLFIHDAPVDACYWMKDTPLHLSIAFIGDGGSILNVEEMAAHSLEGARAHGPVRFVLEMNKGWFAERGLDAGSAIAGLPLLNARTGPAQHRPVILRDRRFSQASMTLR
jgi:uncharacterized membrane protein (UPF0127 family)